MTRYRYDSGYLFTTGVIRAMEAKQVTGEIIGRMAKSSSPGEALEVLGTTYYQDFMAGPDRYGEMLEGRRKWLLDFIDAFSLRDGLGGLFRIGFDYHNIKLLLKEKIFETAREDGLAAEGTIPPGTMTGIFESEGYRELPECMGRAVQVAVESYYASRNPLVIDCVADRCLFEDLSMRAATVGSPFIIAHYRALADLTNIHTFLRAGGLHGDPIVRKELYVPGGAMETGCFENMTAGDARALEDLARRYGYDRAGGGIPEFAENPFAVEREIDNTLAEQLEGSRFLLWGVEPLFAFGRETEIELAVLGVVLAGITGGMSAEAIAGRLPSRFRSAS